MNELMVHVERVVRPVRAGAERKDRMREELLAHLSALVEEERVRAGDERAALEAALGRLGDRAELTRQLQESVSPRDRNAYYLERWLTRRPRESEVRHLLRVSLSFFLLSAVLSSAAVVLVVLVGRRAVDLPLRLGVGGSFLLTLHVDLFLLGLLYLRVRDALCIGPGGWRSWLRAAAPAALAAVVAPASGFALGLLPAGSLEDGLTLLYLWCPFVLLIPVGFIVVGLLHGPVQLRHAEWRALDLGE